MRGQEKIPVQVDIGITMCYTNYIIRNFLALNSDQVSQYMLKADIPWQIIEDTSHISGSMREKPWKQNC